MDDVEDKDLILAGEIFKSMTKSLKTFKAYPIILPKNWTVVFSG